MPQNEGYACRDALHCRVGAPARRHGAYVLQPKGSGRRGGVWPMHMTANRALAPHMPLAVIATRVSAGASAR